MKALFTRIKPPKVTVIHIPTKKTVKLNELEFRTLQLEIAKGERNPEEYKFLSGYSGTVAYEPKYGKFLKDGALSTDICTGALNASTDIAFELFKINHLTKVRNCT